jgi:glycosyltransferase involved in cell wall biosynthesis
MALSKDTPFVVFGDDWGRYPSTLQHTFRHIARRYPVVWINGIGHRSPRLNRTDLKRAWEKLVRTAAPPGAAAPSMPASLDGTAPLAIIEPVVLPWHQSGLVRALNTWSLTRAIRKQMAAHGLTNRPVVVTGSPPSVGVLGRLREVVSVYYVLDDFLNFPTYTASMLAPLERALLERVDMVVGTAASLTRSKFPRSGRAFHLPQGVNYAHFSQPRPEPEDLAGIPHPRIGFAGSVSTQCDVSLLARLANDIEGASLVLVGPVALDEQALAPLARPNVHILGMRPYDILPAYVQHFDVGVIPYVISSWTVAVDPLKLLEYQAAGLPVVCTPIPEAAKYRQHIAVADGDEFVAAVRDALALDPSEARRRGQALARQHTWDRRADQLLELIERVAEEVRGAAAPRSSARGPHGDSELPDADVHGAPAR